MTKLSAEAYAIVEGPVRVGPGSVVHAHARLLGPLTMGARNVVPAPPLPLTHAPTLRPLEAAVS